MLGLLAWSAVAISLLKLCFGRVIDQQQNGTLEIVFGQSAQPSHHIASIPTHWNESLVTDTIINGEQADITDWPSLVLLQNNGSYLCSGVLVKKDIVLTAAHCVVGLLPSRITAVFGVQHVGGVRDELMTGTSQVIPVHSIHNYFFYTANPPRNDISVIILERKVDISFLTNPIAAITSVPKKYKKKNKCFAVGYGVTSSVSKAAALSQMEIPLIDNTLCTGLIDGVRSSNICGFEQLFGKSGCFGDSGGPLYCKKKNRIVLVGLTSFGYSDCRGPTVFSRISSFKWFLRLFGLNVE